jgi:putative endonuclease
VGGIAVRALLLIKGRMSKVGYVYILASAKHGTLYVGVTSDIARRTEQHRKKVGSGFASRHNIKRLVYCEMIEDISLAITREKQLKKWNRDWKIRIIEEQNPDWLDLATGLGFGALPAEEKKPFRHSREGGNP